MDITKLKDLAGKMPSFSPMAAKKDSVGTVYLYREISPEEYGGISAQAFVNELQSLKGISTLEVRINSIGGSVIEAMGIYNALLAFPAKDKIVYVDGLAASAASFIAMAGTRIVMAESAMMMVHSPWATTGGNAADLRAMADLLDKNETTLVNIYSKRTKQDETKIRAMLAAETFMTAQECLDLGFADEIAGQAQETKIAAKMPDILTIAAVTRRVLSEEESRLEMEILRRTI
jgi:ATP-dependent Clp protease protease subunit